MKHTFSINIEGENLPNLELSELFETYELEIEDNSIFILMNGKYLEPIELDAELSKLLDTFEASGIKIGYSSITSMSLWINIYNDGNPFSWSFLNNELLKALAKLNISIELEFYPIELTLNG